MDKKIDSLEASSRRSLNDSKQSQIVHLSAASTSPSVAEMTNLYAS